MKNTKTSFTGLYLPIVIYRGVPHVVHPKDIVPKGKKTNVVYRAVCGVCGDDYVDETQQPLAKWAHQHTHPAAG